MAHRSSVRVVVAAFTCRRVEDPRHTFFEVGLMPGSLRNKVHGWRRFEKDACRQRDDHRR